MATDPYPPPEDSAYDCPMPDGYVGPTAQNASDLPLREDAAAWERQQSNDTVTFCRDRLPTKLFLSHCLNGHCRRSRTVPSTCPPLVCPTCGCQVLNVEVGDDD